MPILGAVLSFGPGTSENATMEATAQFDIDDGSNEVKNYSTLSWLRPSNKVVNSQDGLVNLYQ